MIAAVTSENGQTQDGAHIYTHDRHCRAVLPVPAEQDYSSYARRRVYGMARNSHGAHRWGSLGPRDEGSQTLRGLGASVLNTNLPSPTEVPLYAPVGKESTFDLNTC